MAKLEGVKVLDMVGGEITKVAYDGVEYVKIDNVKEPIDGDIALNNKESESYTEGAFYELRAGLSKFGNFITKSDNDGAGYNGKHPKFWTVFRKVSASKPTIDERVDSLEKRVDALEEKPEPTQPFKEGDVVVITGNTKMRHATQAEREQYEESLKPKEPKLKAGDWVKFAEDGADITAGKVYEIKANADGDLYFLDDEGDDRTYPISGDSDYQFEIVAPPSVFERIGREEGEFKVGDIVRVTDTTLGHPVGTIGIVEYDENSFVKLRVRANGELKSHSGKMELIAPVESRVDRP